MKTEPKLPDLLNVLIPQIEELTESIKKTKDVQKQIDDRLQKLSEVNTDIDTKRMESILREFEKRDNRIKIIDKNLHSRISK